MMGTPIKGTWVALLGVATLGLWSSSSWQLLPRSRFLDELPPEGVEWPESENQPKLRCGAVSSASGHPPEDIDEWTIGTLVRHPQHGLGQILSIHRGTRRTHVDVQFENGSRKSWVVEFADLQRVDFDEVG